MAAEFKARLIVEITGESKPNLRTNWPAIVAYVIQNIVKLGPIFSKDRGLPTLRISVREEPPNEAN